MTEACLSVGEPDPSTAVECPTCGFDTLLPFPLYLLLDTGVSHIGYYPACLRCYDRQRA